MNNPRTPNQRAKQVEYSRRSQANKVKAEVLDRMIELAKAGHAVTLSVEGDLFRCVAAGSKYQLAPSGDIARAVPSLAFIQRWDTPLEWDEETQDWVRRKPLSWNDVI